jgi:hypothetical protein
MTTRRIQPHRNTDGSNMNYQQRRQMRLRQEREQRVQERKQREQQQIEAVLNPPAAPLPYRERVAQRKAEAEGKAQAQYEAEQVAKSNAAPRNLYRERAEALRGELYKGESVRKRFDHFNRLADAEDASRAAQAEQAAKQAATDSDPAVANARESATYLQKMAEATGQQELIKRAQECGGIAQAGDASLYWRRAAEVEAAILSFHDAKAAERRAAKLAADAEYEAAATAAQESKARRDAAISAGEVVERAAE